MCRSYLHVTRNSAEMPYSDYLKNRALCYRSQGLSSPRVAKRLKEEGLIASRQGLAKFFNRYDKTGSAARRPGSGRISKLTSEVLAIVEGQMQMDDETTAVQLMALLAARNHPLSLSTILRCRRKLSWTFRGSAYCQLIRAANKIKRLQFAKDFFHEAASGFNDVVYTDETSIQLESHRRFCCHKRGQLPRNKPRYRTRLYTRSTICFNYESTCIIIHVRT